MEKVKDFKSVCLKIGLVMSVFFVSRMFCSIAIAFMEEFLSDYGDTNFSYICSLILQDLFLYIIPIISAVLLLNIENPFGLYKKPPRFAKALGNFPALYGLGQLTNVLTLVVFWIISNFSAESVELEKSFGTMESILPPNFSCAVALFIRMVFSAAIYEEFLARGLILGALKPYGNGFAIIVSAFLFGIMHGNFQQFFYAFIVGIVLGYITVQTNSILTSTILHALFNSIAATVILFLSTETFLKFWYGELFEYGASDGDMIVLAAFGMFIIAFVGLLVSGVVLAVKKIARIKKYRIENPWTDITGGTKTAIFFTRATVIAMLVLTVDAFAGSIIVQKIMWILFYPTLS